MTGPARLAAALAVVAVSIALPFARTPAGRPDPAPTASFSAMGLSFRPVDVLPPGGVLVRWDDNGFPGSFWKPTPNTTIAGHPAEETVTSGPGWCASLGGAETITVTIPRHQPDNFYEMAACLSAPDLSQHEAQISAMLRTLQLAQDG